MVQKIRDANVNTKSGLFFFSFFYYITTITTITTTMTMITLYSMITEALSSSSFKSRVFLYIRYVRRQSS